MREEADIRSELVERIQHLPAEQIKQAVLQWLGTTESNLVDLEQTLTQDSNSPQLVYGTVDNQNTFVTLSEEEMVAQSLSALAEFQQSGRGIDSKTMASWVDSLGTDKQSSCPQ